MRTATGTRAHRRDARGFSALEVLISASLLAVSMLGVATTLPAAGNAAPLVRQHNKATTLVRQMMEAVRNDAFGHLHLYNGMNGRGVDTRDFANFPADASDDAVASAPGSFTGRAQLLRWRDDIARAIHSGQDVTGAYGTVRVQSIGQDADGNGTLDKITVTVHWGAGGAGYNVRLISVAARS